MIKVKINNIINYQSKGYKYSRSGSRKSVDDVDREIL